MKMLIGIVIRAVKDQKVHVVEAIIRAIRDNKAKDVQAVLLKRNYTLSATKST